jgi:hypothetical protein
MYRQAIMCPVQEDIGVLVVTVFVARQVQTQVSK